MPNTLRMTVELPQGLHDRFFALSRMREGGRRVTMSEHVRRAMLEYANRVERKAVKNER